MNLENVSEYGKREKVNTPFLLQDPDSGGRVGGRVGIAWIEEHQSALMVTPKFPNLNASRMMRDAWGEVRDFQKYEGKKNVYGVRADQALIEVANEDVKPHLLLLVTSYVMGVSKLLRRMRKKEYRMHRENLQGRIKGKLLINDHLRTNVVNGRSDRAVCQYPVFEEDNPINRILKGALRVVVHFLDTLDSLNNQPDSALSCSLRTELRQCFHVLETVKELPASELGSGIVQQAQRSLRGFYSPFKPSFRLALFLLRGKGGLFQQNSDSKEKNGTTWVPPFFINMPALFECYVNHHVKSILQNDWQQMMLGGKPVDAKSQPVLRDVAKPDAILSSRRPDLLMEKSSEPQRRLVVEVKYHRFEGDQDWLSQFIDDESKSNNESNGSDRERPRHGFFQTVAYMTLFNADCGIIVCPSLKAEIRQCDLGYDTPYKRFLIISIAATKDAENPFTSLNELISS